MLKMQPYFVPSQVMYYSSGYDMPYFQLPVQIPVHEIGVMTVASPNLEVSSNRNPSPIKSPRVTISPDLEPRFSKSKTTPTKLNAKAGPERATPPAEEPEELVHYRIIEVPVEKLVEKA